MALQLTARLPARRDLNSILNVALPLLLILSFSSGWLAALLGLTDFGLHRYSSVAVFVVALGHVALHWRRLEMSLRRRAGVVRPLPIRSSLPRTGS